MADEKEKILKDILSELKSLRQDLYKIQRDMKTLEHIESEVKEIKRKIR